MLITQPTGLIVFALVDEHKGMPVNELAAITELDSLSVKTALNNLLEQEIVKQKGRNSNYCLAKY